MRRKALRARLRNALAQFVELGDDGLRQHERRVALVQKLIQHLKKRGLPLVSREVEPDARVDEKVEHRGD